MAGGLINIDRGLLNHRIFKPKKFSKAEAWIWLLCEARWKDWREDIGGKTVTINRGQVPHSLRFMATAWGWSKGGTERFLNRLKIEAMIGTISIGGQNVITICNYNTYQSYEKYRTEKVGTDNGTELGQSWDRVGTELGQTITPETPETPDESLEGASKKTPKRKATRLPEDWILSVADRQYAIDQGVDPDKTLEDFKDYWISKSQNATKLDWSRTWKSWCRKSWNKENGKSDNDTVGRGLAAGLAKLDGLHSGGPDVGRFRGPVAGPLIELEADVVEDDLI